MDIYILLLWITLGVGHKLVNSEKRNDIRYQPINCYPDLEISEHSPCGGTTGDCYHTEVMHGEYPLDGFCLFDDPAHGLEPGVIGYTMAVYVEPCLYAGKGIYFNLQDYNNYEAIYKIDCDSSICILGYVEEGRIHNRTTFACKPMQRPHWPRFFINVTNDDVHFKLIHNVTGIEDQFSFKPYFSMVPKAGPLAANGFDNNYLHNQDIILNTVTCGDQPTHPMCNPCNFAYNVQSLPVYPLPDNQNFLLWHSRALEMVYSSCFFKVVVDKLTDGQVVMADSKVGQFSYKGEGPNEEDINVGEFYGERNQCTESKVACVEIKVGGTVTNGEIQDIDKTHINVTVADKSGLFEIVVNPNLELIYGSDIIPADDLTFQMYIHDRAYGSDFGIYCYTTRGSAITAEEYAYNMCAAGNNDGSEPPVGGINQQNWAIKFQ